MYHECREGDEKGLQWGFEVGDQQHDLYPVGRVGRGEDIAEAVEYLMGAGFINGQELTIDGGAGKVKQRAVVPQ